MCYFFPRGNEMSWGPLTGSVIQTWYWYLLVVELAMGCL
jgi:hypothetical protein